MRLLFGRNYKFHYKLFVLSCFVLIIMHVVYFQGIEASGNVPDCNDAMKFSREIQAIIGDKGE